MLMIYKKSITKISAHITNINPTATPILVTQVPDPCCGGIARTKILPIAISNELIIVI